jgi:hypothetical protein
MLPNCCSACVWHRSMVSAANCFPRARILPIASAPEQNMIELALNVPTVEGGLLVMHTRASRLVVRVRLAHFVAAGEPRA